MNSGTRRNDGVVTTCRAGRTGDLVTWAGTMRLGRTAAVVRGGDGVEGAERGEGAERVAADDERLGVVEVMESVGSGDVGTDAVSGEDRVTPALAEPSAPAPAPAQPANNIESTAAPARERAAYERACPTKTHASERTNAEGSKSDMMAW